MIKVIETEVPCESCGEKLCNLCGFNGNCEHCGAQISPETDEKVRAALAVILGTPEDEST